MKENPIQWDQETYIYEVNFEKVGWQCRLLERGSQRHFTSKLERIEDTNNDEDNKGGFL